MSAESPRRFARPNGNSVRPQPVADKSVMESVVDFFQEVAYSAQPDDKEKILWVQFEKADVNDANSNPSGGYSSGNRSPLLLVLGYASGIHVWMIPSNGEAQEVMSLRQGPVRLVRFLVDPSPVFDVQDAFASKRPLIVICDASSAGQPYCSAKFLSLRTGDEVHHIPYTEPVTDVQANDRVVVVAFEEKLIVYDACRFRERFTITACFSAKDFSYNVNPFALGSRWLAYADKKLVSVHQSSGGMVSDNSQSYTATILSAAKTLTKGLTLISETVTNSLTGSKPSFTPTTVGGGTHGPSSTKKSGSGSPEAYGCRTGIVTVIDVQNVVDPQVMVQDDSDGAGIVAHFIAHASGQPISMLEFDSSGMLLFTADTLGHSFHIFRILPHPFSSSMGAVHHLYTLYRGDTTAKIQSVDFTLDSRWVAVTTLRGTTHIFPLTVYGGPVNVRTHTSARVVNRASRFHRSAGLEDMDLHVSGRDSPGCAPCSPSSSPGRTLRHTLSHDRVPSSQPIIASNANNPRLPPYPHPTVVTPVAQIRQSLQIPGLGAGGALGGGIAPVGGGGSGGPARSRSSGGSQGAVAQECVSVAACFAPSRGFLAATPPSGPADEKHVVDSLFVVNWTGTLVEYTLEPHAKTGLDKVTDESPVDMTTCPRAQWPLGRSITASEVKLPLPSNHPLILASDAILSHKLNAQQVVCQGQGQTARDRQQPGSDSSADENDEQWLSQVEIVTHTGPHRRLWMGPQFAFKAFQTESGSVLSCDSPVLLSDCNEANVTMMDVDSDLTNLCLNAQSSPLDVASGSIGRRSHVEGATVVADTCGSLPYATIIEAADSGSFQSPGLLETQFGFLDSSPLQQQHQQQQQYGSVDSASESIEDQLRKHLADAMIESPPKDIRGGPVSGELMDAVRNPHNSSRSYLAYSSPPHSIDQLLVFSGDPPSPSSSSSD